MPRRPWQSVSRRAISGEIEAELLKGLDSGPAVQITPEFLADLKRRARAKRGNAGDAYFGFATPT